MGKCDKPSFGENRPANMLAEVQAPLEMHPMDFLKLPDGLRMKEQAAPFDGKTVYWIATPLSDSKGYVHADIVGTETKQVKKEECDQMNPPKYEKCTDMSNLTFL